MTKAGPGEDEADWVDEIIDLWEQEMNDPLFPESDDDEREDQS